MNLQRTITEIEGDEMNSTKTVCQQQCPKFRGSLSVIKFPCYAEHKLDGEWTIFDNTDTPRFINKHDKCRTDGLVDRFAEIIGNNKVVIMGELYYDKGKKDDLYSLLSNKLSDDLGFYPFDIIRYNDIDCRYLPLSERKEILDELVKGWKRPKTKIIKNEKELNSYFENIIEKGYEGIVVKNKHGKMLSDTFDWVKMKYTDTNDYEVALIDGYQQRIEIDCKTVHGVNRVGVKVSNSDKAKLKIGDLITVEHFGITKSGKLRNPVFKGIVPRKQFKRKTTRKQ